MMIEQRPGLVAEQAKAISNLKIDKMTVWDGGGNRENGNGTAGFVSSLVKVPAAPARSGQQCRSKTPRISRPDSGRPDQGTATGSTGSRKQSEGRTIKPDPEERLDHSVYGRDRITSAPKATPSDTRSGRS